MGKCIRCWEEAYSKKICSACLSSWSDMRIEVYGELEKALGHFSFQNQIVFKKEMKRLEKIWRKDKDKFQQEVLKINLQS